MCIFESLQQLCDRKRSLGLLLLRLYNLLPRHSCLARPISSNTGLDFPAIAFAIAFTSTAIAFSSTAIAFSSSKPILAISHRQLHRILRRPEFSRILLL